MKSKTYNKRMKKRFERIVSTRKPKVKVFHHMLKHYRSQTLLNDLESYSKTATENHRPISMRMRKFNIGIGVFYESIFSNGPVKDKIFSAKKFYRKKGRLIDLKYAYEALHRYGPISEYSFIYFSIVKEGSENKLNFYI